MFTLRRATGKDVRRNFEIWRSAVLATHQFLSERDFQDISVLVEKSYLPAAALVVAVDEEDMPHGFLGMTDDNVDALFVHAESRGKGIGRLLLESFLAARDEVTVDVNEQNRSGRKFYEKVGFQVIGRSDVDDAGRPYPLMHMRWRRS
ncbi:acetyltransferase [Sinorhizobium medicae]|uniref:acetyltransferase n=1 Tax=Rhizobium meliloti TaxID=382 RepID=UPI001296AFB5|nr:acetyltransferase [Sinorhizobium meliloti]MDX0847226.1 acetyltransferase [Sinorhizobium medicae]MQW47459.1 acetyltransferase [Sinorhizobium meliloti]